ncbi:MAG: phenol degradation protein meta [Planctomycetes bacterium]|nr:phenol degradation protein meta [Planctomycetota bacterium]
MKHRRLLLPTVGLVLALLVASSAMAYQQPLVNLGFTSFLDGAPPAGPGFYFTQYVMYWTADRLPGIDSPVDRFRALGSLSQLIYQSNTPVLFGGKWGIDFILPLASFETQPINNNDGFGDLLVGPYLQWDPIMGPNGPIFMHRVELQTIWPIGTYDADHALNPSSNFFSFNPYWAGTLFLTPKWELSLRVHYLWNAKNTDPFVGFGFDEIQPGQAIHANFAASYEAIAKKLRIGVNGYFFEQITDTKGDGVDIGEDESVFAIGPGALWSFSQHTHLFLNAYFESNARSRPEGEKFILRFVHHFQ